MDKIIYYDDIQYSSCFKQQGQRMDDPKVHVCVCTQCTQFYPFGMTTGSIISSMGVFWVPFWFRAVVFCPILRHIFQLLYMKPTYNKTLGKCFITKLSVESVHSFDTFDKVTEHLGHRLRRKQARRVQSPEQQHVITTLYMTCSFDLSQSLLLLQSKSQELCGKECFQCMLLHALLKRRGHTAAGRQRQLFVFTKIRSLDMVAKNAKQKGFQCKPCKVTLAIFSL